MEYLFSSIKIREENYKKVFEELNTAKLSIIFWNYKTPMYSHH